MMLKAKTHVNSFSNVSFYSSIVIFFWSCENTSSDLSRNFIEHALISRKHSHKTSIQQYFKPKFSVALLLFVVANLWHHKLSAIQFQVPSYYAALLLLKNVRVIEQVLTLYLLAELINQNLKSWYSTNISFKQHDIIQCIDFLELLALDHIIHSGKYICLWDNVSLQNHGTVP